MNLAPLLVLAAALQTQATRTTEFHFFHSVSSEPVPHATADVEDPATGEKICELIADADGNADTTQISRHYIKVNVIPTVAGFRGRAIPTDIPSKIRIVPVKLTPARRAPSPKYQLRCDENGRCVYVPLTTYQDCDWKETIVYYRGPYGRYYPRVLRTPTMPSRVLEPTVFPRRGPCFPCQRPFGVPYGYPNLAPRFPTPYFR